MKREHCRNLLLGIGFDCGDGHIRITKGENFRLYGGSGKTHKTMQEKALQFNERMDKRGKTIDTISKEEFCEIASQIGLKLPTDEE